MNPATRTHSALIERPGLAQAAGLTEVELEAIERRFPQGMTVQEIVSAHVERGLRLTEATFRKYVQLGLLPQSVRVGRKGKHRGSQGLYPVSAVRQIDHIRRLMARGFTIEEIQRDFLFVRGDIEALRRQLERIYGAFDEAIGEKPQGGAPLALDEQLSEARAAGTELLGKLEGLERQLTLRARMAKAVV
jgi:DNA-binding transcriptional MerR regulator